MFSPPKIHLFHPRVSSYKRNYQNEEEQQFWFLMGGSIFGLSFQLRFGSLSLKEEHLLLDLLMGLDLEAEKLPGKEYFLLGE
jgi:hypothetical protein